MRTIKAMLGIATGMALLLVAASASAAPTCVVKAGLGTGSSKDDAKFQAWEAVLQATSWTEAWSPWMSAGGKVGTAPGYKVSGVREKCKAGGLGQECTMQAKLCK
jgi:hypothetical protein